jgi:hypothetical protein
VSIETITSPLPGERVVGLSPGDAGEASITWLRRPNLFPGRALTAASLQQRQQWQAGRIVERASTWVAGIDDGLELQVSLTGPGLAGVRLTVSKGLGLAASGEDVVLQRPLSCSLADVPVVAPASFFIDGTGVGNSGPGGVLLPRGIGASLGNLSGPARAALPALGVLVLQPVRVDTANLDPLDPCDRSAFDEGTAEDPAAFEDWRVGDGVRLLWYVWPGEWRAVNASAAQLRNVAAWTVFQAEADLPRDDAVPWDTFGLPVALAALDTANDLRPLWVDRASVARRGGRARDARLRSVGTAVAADPRLPSLWQARIEQFAEQVAAMDGATPAQLAAAFERHLPPVGLLPKHCFVPLSQHSGFFPPLFDLDAAPVPVEQLDLAVRASAGLAPLDLTQAESVRLLVPVPLAHWEPRLLIREVVDPEFQRTLDRYLLTRSRELGARQGLRHKAAMLSHALDGQVHTVPGYKDDPAATEPESLKPWGEPPPGGGHRSALMAGLHQHYFDGATPTFEVLAGESLFVWACLDPDHPPRTLMLQWHSVPGTGTGAGSWEHRAYWGEDSIALGAPDGSAAHLRMGDLPTAGAWVMLTVPAASLGLAGQQIDGMAFTLQDGRAAFGLAGARTANDWRKWFCNFLPLGARAQGNEPWDLLTANDLWVPFDPHDGVVPSLPDIVVAAAGGVIPGEGDGATTYRAVPTSGFNVRYVPADGWRGHAHILTALHDLNLPAADADRLNAWLYLDELTPPRSILAYVVCRSVNPSTGALVGGSQLNVFFWGENRLPELVKASPNFSSIATVARQVGPLPQSGTWTELHIPIAEQGEGATGRVRIQAVLFMATGGDLAFSDLFIRRGLPADEPPPPELLWPTSFSGDVTVPPVMPFLNARLVFQNNLGVLTPTPSSRIGTVRTYTELIRDPLIQRLSAHEQSQLLLRGLSGFADYLRRRIDRADDITDFGFAHMQVDIHRIRQLMMSTSDAARLAVSPALAAIAKSDSALVVQGQISEYIDTVRASAATPRAGVLQAVSAAAGAAAAGGFSATATASASVQASAGVLKAAGIATQAKLITPPRAPLNIVYAQPVIGLSEIRTVAIADRLRQPPSTEARDYALANRHRTVRSLLDLLEAFMAEDSGSAPAMLADFDIFGLPGDPFLAGANQPRRKLTEFRNNPALLEQLRSPPPLSTTTVDEAGLFTQTVALSDSTIAILRQLEARLIAYRDALNRCDTALAGLLADITGTSGRLAAVEDALAEARHDVSVARALLAEETVRIAGINTRRTRVLDEEVKFIAYIRPRECDNLRATPTHAVDPALVEAPVPACLREHPDLDEDLLEMLRVVREAPAAWFVKMPALVRKLDRVEHLQRSLQTAQARVAAGLSVPRPVAVPQGAARLRQAIARVAVRQAEALAPRVAALQALDLNLFAAATWKTVQVQAQQVLSFGDLADGAHGRSDVAQSAAAELHGIRSIVACLHAEFCGVMPALRLAWADTLSEFDEAPSLRNLGSLARWSEIDSVDRRQMQAYVDWLFSQVEPGQPQAVALINDVVRMCLLLASHAPVDRIISGRLARPITGVSPGIRIPLTVLDPRRLRVGMQAVLYRADTVVARAVVEDLGQQEVSAHVIHTSATRVDLGDDVRVHFDDEAMLSLGAASAKRSLFGR